MSVQSKIFAACFGFCAIIAVLGGLAHQQAAEMGRLAIDIYDHGFMGMSYVDQAEYEFLRLSEAHREAKAADFSPADKAALAKVLTRLDVALERAASPRTREAGVEVRGLLTALPAVPEAELTAAMGKVDQALVKLVKKFGADGLDARDAAEELAGSSAQLVLMEIGGAIFVAVLVGWVVGRNLSRPLVRLVRDIGALAGGELQQEIPPALLRRRDEIGQVARASEVFRDAMLENARIGENQERMRELGEREKIESMQRAADMIERETTLVVEKSVESGDALMLRAQELSASASRVMVSVGAVAAASAVALERGELVAEAGEKLSASAIEIANQIGATAGEIAGTVAAGQRAGEIIDQLSAAVGQIGAVAQMIGGIASQTNLLALNATIEAARAGEAGRGFAVVANEVKTLATQTAVSSEDISRKTSGIHQVMENAERVVREMVTRVASIERITQAVAAASVEQRTATGDIARNVIASADAVRDVSRQIGTAHVEVQNTDRAVTDMQDLAATVSTHIKDLRGVMIRIVRTSSDEVNRRADVRVPINGEATLMVGGQTMTATCIDLSRGGARFKVADPLPAGAKVLLQVPGLPQLTGATLTEGSTFGVRFDWGPEDAPPELREFLDGRKTA